jgi:hypothetical protein
MAAESPQQRGLRRRFVLGIERDTSGAVSAGTVTRWRRRERPYGMPYNGVERQERCLAIIGFPDRERHGYCFYCHQWYDLSAGARVIPEAAGPISAMRAAGAAITGDESALNFVCHRCARRRRLTKRILFGVLIAAILIVLVLERLRLI